MSYFDDGLQVIDISDPTNPIGVAQLTDTGSLALDGAENVFVQGNLAYVTTSEDNGLQVIALEDTVEVNFLEIATSIKTSSLRIDNNARLNTLSLKGGLTVGASANITGNAQINNGLRVVGDILRFEDFSGGSLQTDASGNLSVSSDERLKTLEGEFATGLAALLELEPIRYRWNELSGLDQEHVYVGFSAQNVQAVIPEAVGQDPRGYLTLNDRPIVAALVNAAKELIQKNKQLKEKNDTLKTRLDTLIKEVELLESQ